MPSLRPDSQPAGPESAFSQECPLSLEIHYIYRERHHPHPGVSNLGSVFGLLPICYSLKAKHDFL